MTSRHPAVSCACPKCQSERRTTPPPTPAAEEREAVDAAFHKSWCAVIDLLDRDYITPAKLREAIVPFVAAEILAAEANERARIVAWLRATSTGLDLTKRRIADAIEHNEHGAGK